MVTSHIVRALNLRVCTGALEIDSNIIPIDQFFFIRFCKNEGIGY